jgi:hypothetical protein
MRNSESKILLYSGLKLLARSVPVSVVSDTTSFRELASGIKTLKQSATYLIVGITDGD